MKKIIFPIIFLLLVTSIMAVENYHAYNESQFGNIQVQIGTDGGEAFGLSYNITLCVEAVAPMDGYINSFYFDGDTYVSSNDYCINTEKARPKDGYWNGFYTVITGCDTNVSGTMMLDSVENVTNYLNYKFYEGEQIYFCMQEPTNAGTMQLNTFATNSRIIDEGNETWDVIQQPLLDDLRQWKVATEGNGVWYKSNTIDWYRRSKAPQMAQFCMKPSAIEDEVCYTIAGQEQNIYNYACGELDDKVGEIFQWQGSTGTIMNKIDMWLTTGTLLSSGAEFKIGLDHIDISDNSTTNLYLSGIHNYSEINGTINIRKVTEETSSSNMTLIKDEYYLLYFICTQGCFSPASTKGICSAFNYYHANPYFVHGFQGDTGKMFIEGLAGSPYTEYDNMDMNFLLTATESVWVEIPECNDTIDNDGDGLIDYPDDPSCDSPSDTTESPFSYQCNDTIDNDGDGWIDFPFDPQCDNYTDHNESPYDYDCNDGYDNDLDGYFDYPADPSCSSLTDDDESPQDNPQCNDGIDNDFDGFIDFPDDPSCNGTTDNDESPADFSEQEEDDCLESLNCLIYDGVPYSDSPFLHGWYGQESDTQIVSFLGGYSIDLDTVDESLIKENVIIYKNISHTNNYNYLYGQFVLAIFEEEGFVDIDSEPIYLQFSDYDQNPLVWAMLNVSSSDTAYDIEAILSVYDGNTWEYVSTLYTDDSDNGYIKIEFDIDEINDRFRIQWTDMIGSSDYSSYYDYADTGIGQVQMAMITNTLDRNESQVLLNLIELKGTDSLGYETFCSSWEIPLHLKEEFNGYMSECNWNVDPDMFMWSKLSLENEIEDFMLYKIFDDDSDNAIYYDKSRYGAVKFDYTPYSDSTSVNTMNLYLYDLAFSNAFVRLFFKTNGNVDSIVDGDNYNIYGSLVMDTTKEVKIVVDLVSDTFDFYYDDSLIEANIGFHNEFLNVDYFNGIYFQSTQSHYEIDNLEVYESDSDGIELPNIQDPILVADETKVWCELFTKTTPSCSTDNDCETGKCLPNKKCSSFDFTYCDEKGKTRGNMCMVSGMTSCVLKSSGNIILGNFFYFLVALIIIMGLVYITIMFRN